MNTAPEKLTFTVAEAVSSTGIGRTMLYSLIKAGQLESRKIGRKTLIPARSLHSLVDGLPAARRTAA